MCNMNRNDVLEQARKVYGIRNQLAVAAEECNELAIALLKFVRYENETDGVKKTREKVLEERADVDIVLNHIDSIYGFTEDEIYAAGEAKIQRLKNWLDKSNRLEQSTIDRAVPSYTGKNCSDCFWFEHFDEIEAKEACISCKDYNKKIG